MIHGERGVRQDPEIASQPATPEQLFSAEFIQARFASNALSDPRAFLEGFKQARATGEPGDFSYPDGDRADPDYIEARERAHEAFVMGTNLGLAAGPYERAGEVL